MNALAFIVGSGGDDVEASTLEKVFKAILVGLGSWGAMLGLTALQDIGKIIDQHNKHTENFDTEAKAARILLERDEIIKSLLEWQDKQATFLKAEEDLDSLKKRLLASTAEILDLERQVRQHRQPAEELNLEMASYLGRDELKFEVKDNGYAITRNGLPAMHLSEGERTAITFMYFLKSLSDNGFDLKNGVVIIDDPVSSLDANSLYCAFAYLKKCTQEAAQLFVLTHNFSFFRQVKNWFNFQGDIRNRPYIPEKSKAVHFYMLNSGPSESVRNARIERLDPLLHAYESEYHYLFRCVKDGAALNVPQLLNEVYGMPNIARRLLESFLAFRIPGKAGELRQQVEQLDGDPAKKARIVRFLHTHSHADHISEPEHDLSILSETPTILSEILELMKVNDRSHYEAMIAIV